MSQKPSYITFKHSKFSTAYAKMQELNIYKILILIIKAERS